MPVAHPERRSYGRKPGWVGRAALIAALVAVLSACGTVLEQTRRHSYAPDFNYIADDQLESAMWRLAAGVRSLEAILANDHPIGSEQRIAVIRILEQMKAASDALGPEGMSSNHPRITRNLGRFRERLEMAHRAVSRQPPSYYLAGTLSGACLACHASE